MSPGRDQRGASSAEYLGVLALVVAVLVALTTLDVGGRIAGGMEWAVCRIAGASCPGPEGTAAPPAPPARPAPPTCTTARREYESRFSTNFLFDRSTSGTRYVVREMSDGSVIVLDTSYEGSGSVAGVGFDVPVAGRALSLDVGSSAEGIVETGLLYVLESPEEIAAYRAFQTKPAIDAYVSGGLSLEPLDPDYQRVIYMTAVALSDRTYSRVGREVTVSLGASFRGLYGDLELGAGSAKVIEKDKDTGAVTVSWEMDASAGGQLGLMLAGEVGGESSGGLGVSLTLDEDGEPTRLELTAVRQLQAGATLFGGDLASGIETADLPRGLAVTADLAERDEAAGMAQITATLDLTDPETRRAAVGFAGQPGPATAAALLRRLDDSATVLVEAYGGTVEAEGTSAGIALGPTLGFTTEDTVTRLELTGAWSWNPAGGGQRRTDCLR